MLFLALSVFCVLTVQDKAIRLDESARSFATRTYVGQNKAYEVEAELQVFCPAKAVQTDRSSDMSKALFEVQGTCKDIDSWSKFKSFVSDWSH